VQEELKACWRVDSRQASSRSSTACSGCTTQPATITPQCATVNSAVCSALDRTLDATNGDAESESVEMNDANVSMVRVMLMPKFNNNAMLHATQPSVRQISSRCYPHLAT